MKIDSVKIKNFRSYKDEVTVDFENLTVFVGKNDSGKSTILEALDIFFNDGKGLGVTKLDENDINVENKKAEDGDNEIEITVVFAVPEKLKMEEADKKINLKNDYLLNEADQLEIKKRYKIGKSITQKIFIKAYHPTNSSCSDLLLKKQNELKKIIEDNNIDCSNRSVNSVMREAIWKHYEDDGLELNIKEIDVSKEDSKQIWKEINSYLPAYSLFKSDRQNTDSDSEVQDPLKNAVNMILEVPDIKNNLVKIAKEVEKRLEDVSSRTKKMLRAFDEKIAEELKPVIPPTDKLAWSSVFKSVSIFGDDIPINKRGSGVKRLVLLSFFRAEAERQQEDKETKNGVIYAIEEPETSQHTNNQKILIEALKSLSKNNQVILTTHSPYIVKQLEYSNLRILDGQGRVLNNVGHYLKFPSLNEVNFLAYDEISEEYHNELYGALNVKAGDMKIRDFDNWLKEKGLPEYKESGKNPYLATLPTYIRNIMHHPEDKMKNNSEREYSRDDLKESILQLRRIFEEL